MGPQLVSHMINDSQLFVWLYFDDDSDSLSDWISGAAAVQQQLLMAALMQLMQGKQGKQ